MDALAHLSPATRAKRGILNDTLRGLLVMVRDGQGLHQLVYDPARMAALRAAGIKPRTLLS